MKRKHILLTLSLLLVFGTAIAGPNQKDGKMAPRGEQGQRECLLTETERDQVQDAKRDFEKVMIPMRADVKVLMMDIQDMVTAGKSSKEIAPVLDKLNAVKAKMASERLDHQVAVRKIVGEEKYKKMGMAREHAAKHMKGQAGKRGKGQQVPRKGGEYGQRCENEGRFGK